MIAIHLNQQLRQILLLKVIQAASAAAAASYVCLQVLGWSLKLASSPLGYQAASFKSPLAGEVGHEFNCLV